MTVRVGRDEGIDPAGACVGVTPGVSVADDVWVPPQAEARTVSTAKENSKTNSPRYQVGCIFTMCPVLLFDIISYGYHLNIALQRSLDKDALRS